MKKIIYVFAIVVLAIVVNSCGAGKVITYSPEENFLNLTKITDEVNGVVLGPRVNTKVNGDYSKSGDGYSKAGKIAWFSGRLLSISPDGGEIAFLTRDENAIEGKKRKKKLASLWSTSEDNIRVRKISGNSASTQRTFRNVETFSWGSDDNLYFSDASSSSQNPYIGSVNGHAGSVIRQHTNNNSDSNPMLSPDGTKLFFTRIDKTGPFIWSINLSDGSLTSCARGFDQCPVSNDEFYCVRNSASGRSEIWYINYQTGQETMILSDPKISYTNPAVSPDGKWLAVVGNGVDKKKNQNLDIYVVKTDGSNLTRLTYLGSEDSNPVWAKDGKSIFFISSRESKGDWYNVWQMKFNL